MQAYAMIIVEIGTENNVMEDILAIPGVKKTYTVYGVYDVIAEIEGKDSDEIKDISHKGIREHKNVRTSLLLITYD